MPSHIAWESPRPQRAYPICVSQDQHYLPQVYLRQWCTPEGVLRYRYVGVPPRLEEKRKSPKSIMHEPDLYRLPENSDANGRTGNDLEEDLGAQFPQPGA